MRFGKKAKACVVIAVSMSAALCGVFTPSIASTASTAPLIDKDFEVALSKFLSKRFFNRIDANSEQREKLSKILIDTQESTRPLRQEMRQKLLDLSELMASGNASDSQIKEEVASVRALHEKIQDTRLAAVLQARKILTPEQRQLIQTRLTDLISGAARPRKIGMLIRSGGAIFSERGFIQ